MEMIILQNSLKMLQDRGVNIDIYETVLTYTTDNLPAYVDYLKRSENNTFAYLVVKRACNSKKIPFSDRLALSYKIDDILVMFVDIENKLVSKDMISLCSGLALEQQIKNLIIVGPNIPSADGKNALITVKEKYIFQYFKDEELYSRPLEYIWSCKYEIFTKEQTDKFISENNFTVAQIPRLFTTDPIIKWMGAKAGIIVKEINSSFLPGTIVKEDFSYRYLIEEKG